MLRAIAIVIACLLALPPAAPLARSTPTARVPRVVGATESRAQCALAAAGLRWRFRGSAHVFSRPAIVCKPGVAVLPDPQVISQSPAGGVRVRRGSVVVLDDVCLRRGRRHLSPCL
jgi:beta-lactam-binding protein with PASTA domain